MQLKYTAIVLTLATSISAQADYLVMSCNTSPVACQAVGINCNNENTPWACPVRIEMIDYFSNTCRNVNGYPEVRLSSVTLDEARVAAGCK
jgi:hypothetical protein